MRVKDSVAVELVLELTIASPNVILGRLPGGDNEGGIQLINFFVVPAS